MGSSHGKAYLYLSITAISWASNTVAGRLAVEHVSPMAIVTLRWLIVVCLLALFSHRQIRADLPVLRKHWLSLLLLGSLGYTAFNSLFYLAAHYTSAINLGIIQAATPALIVLGGLLAFGTRTRPLRLAGLALTLLGAVWAACRGEWAVLRSMSFNFGDILTLIATVFYAGYTVMLGRLPPIPRISLFSGMALAAFVSSLPILAAEVAVGRFRWPDAAGWAIVAYIAVFPSLLAQLFFMRGVQLIGPGRAGIFTNLVPVLAALMSVSILGEAFETFHAVALALVLGGIWVSERSSAQAPTAKVSE